MNDILQGDSREILKTLPSESVHCCITSPPYFGLRDYGIDNQIGLEESPDEYIDKIVGIFHGVKRVLRPDGTLWLIIGDSYSSDRTAGYKPKDLMGIPWRVAFTLQDDGWYLRSDIVWNKPNAMPESVSDRPTKSHDYIFLFSKSEKYFYDSDAIQERSSGNAHPRGYGNSPKIESAGFNVRANMRFYQNTGKNTVNYRNKRTVWSIPTQPYSGIHNATFPEALAEPCILAGTSEYGCCPVCLSPYTRVVKKALLEPRDDTGRTHSQPGHRMGKAPCPEKGWQTKKVSEYWIPGCECNNPEIMPCRVLDPFFGAGTTGLVSLKHNRSFVGIELNPVYVEEARKRLHPWLTQTRLPIEMMA